MEQCFECGNFGYTENHHVVPRSLGGTKTVPLCGHCHSLAHGGFFKNRSSHDNLIKEGIKKAKDSGAKFGRPRKYNEKLSYISVRLPLEEKKLLDQFLKQNKMTVVSFSRFCFNDIMLNIDNK